MSRFRQDHRVGHLQLVHRISVYLASLAHGAIRYRIHEPDYSDLPHKEYDSARTVCIRTREELPHNLPKLLGKQVTSTHYVDANLLHDLIAGKAVTAILHMLNATPVEWNCKRHLTVVTATFGSELWLSAIALTSV